MRSFDVETQYAYAAAAAYIETVVAVEGKGVDFVADMLVAAKYVCVGFSTLSFPSVSTLMRPRVLEASHNTVSLASKKSCMSMISGLVRLVIPPFYAVGV